jgi:hypothetical protein
MRIVILALLLAPLTAMAQQEYPRDITLSWTNASQYEDGSLIDAGDLTEVRVECFRNNDATPSFTATVPVTGEGLSQSEIFVGVIPSPGTYRCVSYSIIFDGTESVASNSTSKKYTGKPLPPQDYN